MAYTSPNAPEAVNVLGSWLLSILDGQWRYAHVAGLRAVAPEILGTNKVISGPVPVQSTPRGEERDPRSAGSGRWRRTGNRPAAEDNAPFASPPLQRLHHYYELLRPLVAHRYYQPRLLRLCLSPYIASQGSRSST